MLSRRTLFTLGLSKVAERVEEQLDAERLNPTPTPARTPRPKPRVPARPNVPPPRPSWPHKEGAELWVPVSRALPRPADENVLDVDELDFDLARLPFDDGEFDVVVSTFAQMFSSAGRAAIDELFRIVRPGGTVAFCAWTPPGIVGRLLTLAAEHDPPPTSVPAPMDWGSGAYLRHEISRHSDWIELLPEDLMMTFGSREEAVERLFAAFRPLAWAPDQAELRRLAEPIIDELASADAAGVVLRATYVMVVARRRSA
jgi:SAM-dependent methyltransferase